MKFIEDWTNSSLSADVITVALWAAVAALVYVVLRLSMPALRRAARRTENTWDDVILDRRVRHRLALLGPAAVFYALARLAMESTSEWHDFLVRGSAAVVVLLTALTLSAILHAANTIYESRTISRDRPIEPFVQVIQIVLLLFAAVFVIAVLADRPPWFFVGSLGALMAVLLLVFKDSILSFVASIQLVQSDLVDVGDWIEMPEFDADGVVVDMELHTVTVQNADKTITTIPSYKLISGAFRNSRGVVESGRRRIKRSIRIDLSTVRFLTGDEIDRLAESGPLREYMSAKREALIEERSRSEADPGSGFPRRLTNIGTFRAYVAQYLGHLDTVDTGDTFVVRQLEPGPDGLPIEIMAFAKDTSLAGFEGIQADIFDHILAMVPAFGLRLFQSSVPAGLPGETRLPLRVLNDATVFRTRDVAGSTPRKGQPVEGAPNPAP